MAIPLVYKYSSFFNKSLSKAVVPLTSLLPGEMIEQLPCTRRRWKRDLKLAHSCHWQDWFPCLLPPSRAWWFWGWPLAQGLFQPRCFPWRVMQCHWLDLTLASPHTHFKTRRNHLLIFCLSQKHGAISQPSKLMPFNHLCMPKKNP